jgi:hypothetical protein
MKSYETARVALKQAPTAKRMEDNMAEDLTSAERAAKVQYRGTDFERLLDIRAEKAEAERQAQQEEEQKQARFEQDNETAREEARKNSASNAAFLDAMRDMERDAKISPSGEYMWVKGDDHTLDAKRDKAGAAELKGAWLGDDDGRSIATRNQELAKFTEAKLKAIQELQKNGFSGSLKILQEQINDGTIDPKESGAATEALNNAKDAAKLANDALKKLDIAKHGDKSLIEEKKSLIAKEDAIKTELKTSYDRQIEVLFKDYNPAVSNEDPANKEKQTAFEKLQREYEQNFARIESQHNKIVDAAKQEIEQARGYEFKKAEWNEKFPLADANDPNAEVKNAQRGAERQKIEAEYQKEIAGAMNSLREANLQADLAVAQAGFLLGHEDEKHEWRTQIQVLQSELETARDKNSPSAWQQAEKAGTYLEKIEKGEKARAALHAESLVKFKPAIKEYVEANFKAEVERKVEERAAKGLPDDDNAQRELAEIQSEKVRVLGKIDSMSSKLTEQMKIASERIDAADISGAKKDELKSKLFQEVVAKALDDTTTRYDEFAVSFLKKNAPEHAPVDVAGLVKDGEKIAFVQIREGGVIRLAGYGQGKHYERDVYVGEKLLTNGIDMSGMPDGMSLLVDIKSGLGDPDKQMPLFTKGDQYVRVRGTNSTTNSSGRNTTFEENRQIAGALRAINPVFENERISEDLALRASRHEDSANRTEYKIGLARARGGDVNGDGKLSLNELQLKDIDGNGSLTAAELGGKTTVAGIAALLEKDPEFAAMAQQFRELASGKQGTEIAMDSLSGFSVTLPDKPSRAKSTTLNV